MKRILVAIFLILLSVTFVAAQSVETDFSALFVRNSVFIDGDHSLSLQDFGIGGQETLKCITGITSPTKAVSIRYTAILPHTTEGSGKLNEPFVIGGVSYGSTDSEDNQHRDVTIRYKFSDNRFDANLLSFPLFKDNQTYLIGSAALRKAELTIRGVPTKENSKVVETSSAMNRTSLGMGIGGQQPFRNVLVRYRVIYDFVYSQGLLADVDLRYGFGQGFAGIGYYYSTFNTSFDESRMRSNIYGFKVQVGFRF